jgi:hypothetical protein
VSYALDDCFRQNADLLIILDDGTHGIEFPQVGSKAWDKVWPETPVAVCSILTASAERFNAAPIAFVRRPLVRE